MNAQVFCLRSQESLYRGISALVKRHVFEDESIDIEPKRIDDDFSEESGWQDRIHGKEYVRLLKASLISTDDFNILVEDDEGSYAYLGGYEGGHDAKLLRLLRQAMPSAFPAVAVMGRMVMVPKGIHEALTAESFSWMLKPLELGGVVLVDFDDREALREAAQQVGLRLKTEIARLCRRQMLRDKAASPSFDLLSELLRIDREYLERHRDEILASMVQLTPKIVSGPTQQDRRSRVTVEVRNESEKELTGVRMQVRAPKGAMTKPVVQVLDFPAGGARVQRMQFEICPKAAPYCPLEVLFEISETSQSYAPFSVPLILDVSP